MTHFERAFETHGGGGNALLHRFTSEPTLSRKSYHAAGYGVKPGTRFEVRQVIALAQQPLDNFNGSFEHPTNRQKRCRSYRLSSLAAPKA